MEKKRIGLVAIILILMIAGTSAWAEGEETVRKQQKDEAAVLADTEPVEEKTEQAKLKKELLEDLVVSATRSDATKEEVPSVIEFSLPIPSPLILSIPVPE